MLIGIDIAEIKRFENLSDAFLEKNFTAEELSHIRGKKTAERAAASFASKEAFSKALGTGVRGFALADISVLRNELGKPYFEFAPNIKRLLSDIGAVNVELSISHDGGVAAATVIIEQDGRYAAASRLAEKTNVNDSSIITYGAVKASIRPRDTKTHKGDYGRLFILAGSKGLTGAAIMASKGALRSGGGLITLGCAESLNGIFEASLHEVMTMPLPDNGVSLTREGIDLIIEKAQKSDAVVFGCGLSDTKDIYYILKRLLREVTAPIVIDADGLNALSRNINILKTSHSQVVLTPHVGEFARLSGYGVESILAEREKMASELAREYGVCVVLKSDKTVVADKFGNVRTNILGNPGMATGGSGDVLAGVIGSFMGQGIDDAVASAVYIHSLAGDMAAEKNGEYGMIPTDIIESLPNAIDFFCRRD